MVERLAAAGARVEPVESRVTGGQSLTELVPHGAVAIVPEGWPAGDGIALLAVRDDLTLPLVVLWPTGTEPPGRAPAAGRAVTGVRISAPGLRGATPLASAPRVADP